MVLFSTPSDCDWTRRERTEVEDMMGKMTCSTKA